MFPNADYVWNTDNIFRYLPFVFNCIFFYLNNAGSCLFVFCGVLFDSFCGSLFVFVCFLHNCLQYMPRQDNEVLFNKSAFCEQPSCTLHSINGSHSLKMFFLSKPLFRSPRCVLHTTEHFSVCSITIFSKSQA